MYLCAQAVGLCTNSCSNALRALEVYYTSGVPLSDYKLPASPRSGYRFLLIGLVRDRAELYERINQRVEAMFKAGLPEEYKKLRAMGYSSACPGLSAIGYREFSIWNHFN